MLDSQAYRDRRKALAAVAKETRKLTPTVMADLPHLNAARSEVLTLDGLPPLDPAACPGYTVDEESRGSTTRVHGTRVRVNSEDTFDAAIAMRAAVPLQRRTQPPPSASSSSSSPSAPPTMAERVAVLNMASPTSPGGGWLGGSSAQEEALCFRSTLAASLHRDHYPLPSRGGVYTRDVVIFRASMADGHGLLLHDTSTTTPADLPVVSVLTVAGVRRPAVAKEQGGDEGELAFADPAERELTQDKMRLCLRMAAARGHALLVLGALGCGAFRNPPREVARCWAEVLEEPEFAGGWFQEIWFAVYDRKKEGNYEIFRDALDGRVVGRIEKE